MKSFLEKMKKNIIILLPFLISLSLTFDCIAQSNGYFDNIAVVSDGRLTRFSEMPIIVYAEKPDPYASNCLDALNYALKEWEEQSVGVVRFRQTSESDNANILISWVTKMEGFYNEHPLGLAELHRTEKNNFYVELQISLRDPTTAKPLSTEQFRSVLLHEIGHAIGLWGHSKDKNDIMYYAASVQHPTISDIMTLKLVYSYENGYSLHEKSIGVIQADINANPSDAILYFLLGTVYLDQGNYELSIPLLKRCLELNPKYHKAHIAIASAYKGLGQDNLAISEYLTLAQSEPSAMIYNVIATSLYNSGDFNQAIQYYKKSLAIDRTYEPAKRNMYGFYLSRGNESIRQKRYDEAINMLLEGSRAFPDKPEIPNLLGVAYSEMGLYENALEQYKIALKYNPGFIEARNNIASCYNNIAIKYSQSNQWERAIETYKQALDYATEKDSFKWNLSALYWNRAVYYSSMGDTQSAINAYLDYIKLEPNNRDAYNNLGAAYSRLENYDEAVKALERAIQIDPNSQDVKNNLAIAYQKSGYRFMQNQAYERAIREFKKALDYDTDDVNLYLLLAVTHERIGKWEDALQYTETALRFEPENITAKKIMTNIKTQQGNKYLDAQNYDLALKYYSTIPKDMITYQIMNNISYIYIKKEMFLQAVDLLDDVLEINPDDKIAHNNLLSIESKLNKRLLQNRNSQEIKDQLARVKLSIAMSHAHQGNIDKAKRALRSAINLEPKDGDVCNKLNNVCKELAEIFAKKGYNGQSNEILGWIK